MSLPLFLLAFEKETKDTPGKQAAVLVRALDCSVQLLLEVKEAWAFVLTDTILPNPARVVTFIQSTSSPATVALSVNPECRSEEKQDEFCHCN